jgi:hypothetical protein
MPEATIMKRTTWLAGAALFTMLAAPLACEESANTVDCFQVCSRFSDCVTEIDTTECTDACEDRADASEDVELRARACEDCLEDRSCAEAEGCWADCPVVPVAE